MKIEKITPFLVDGFLLVRVYTDEGIVGNGEAGLWAHHKTVHETILELSEYYIGKDPASYRSSFSGGFEELPFHGGCHQRGAECH